jgi:hypothetical protein
MAELTIRARLRLAPIAQFRRHSKEEPEMTWHLQQINGNQTDVAGEYLACRGAPYVGFPNAVFVCTFGDQQHFAFVDNGGILDGATGNLQDCFYDGHTNQWKSQQITGTGGALPRVPAPASAPYLSTFGDELHFAYIDLNSNLQDCIYDSATNKWTARQITGAGGVLTGVPAVGSVSPYGAPNFPLAVCTFGNQLHFTYIDSNNAVQDCYCFYDGGTLQWQLQQINGTDPTAPVESVVCKGTPLVGENPVVAVSTFGNQQHFTYIDGSFNLQDCYYDGDTNDWHSQRLTGGSWPFALPAPSLYANSGVFVCTFGNQQHFVYLDQNLSLQDCFYDGDDNQWKLQQITGGAPTVKGEPVPCPTAPPPGLGFWAVCAFEDELHFTYVDDKENLQDCVYAPGSGEPWRVQQITGGSPTVAGELVPCSSAPALGGPASVSTFGDQLHFTYLHNTALVSNAVPLNGYTMHDVWMEPTFRLVPVRGI